MQLNFDFIHLWLIPFFYFISAIKEIRFLYSSRVSTLLVLNSAVENVLMWTHTRAKICTVWPVDLCHRHRIGRRRPGFYLRPIHAGFLVGKVALLHVLWRLSFFCQCHSAKAHTLISFILVIGDHHYSYLSQDCCVVNIIATSFGFLFLCSSGWYKITIRL